MSEVKWIKLATNIFDDEKIKIIETLPKGDTLLIIWLKLLCLAGKLNNNGKLMLNEKKPYNLEMICTLIGKKENIVKKALDIFIDYEMIKLDNDVYEIINWEKHQNINGLEKIKEQTRKRVEKYRNKKNSSVTVTQNVTQSNDTVTQQNKNKNKKENKNIDIYNNSVADININKIVKCYEENIGVFTPATAELILSYLDDFPVEIIEKAIKIASQHNKKSAKYVQGILNDWLRKGFKTLLDIENEQHKEKNNLSEVWNE